MNNRKNGGLALGMCIGILAGIALMIGPYIVPSLELSIATKIIFTVLGGVVTFISLLLLIITNLFVKTQADQAFVRTGGGGPIVVIDGGIIVIPFLHVVKWVPTNTMKLDVDRSGEDALITQDSLRAAVKASFYIRVDKDEKAVQQAASTLPDMSTGHQPVEHLISDKLVSALRTVAAGQTLHDLNANRQQFAEGVQQIIAEDLKPNGLTLEAVTISNLDQAPIDALRPDSNVFDAAGAATIAQVVNARKLERKGIELDTERQIVEREVATRKYIAAQELDQARVTSQADADREQAQSEAKQASQQAITVAETTTRIKQAEANSRAETASAQQKQIAETERVGAERAVELALVSKQQALEIANQEREQALKVATIVAGKAAEMAQQDRQIALATKEKERAEATTQQLVAQNQQEAANQAVQTTIALAEAERKKQQTIIAKEAQAQESRITAQAQADLEAYKVVTQANAEQEAAQKRASAQLIQAEAQKSSSMLQAEGDKALALVPVQVERQRVEVRNAEVDVLTRELEAKSANEGISVQLQSTLALIDAWKSAEIARAEAMGRALSAANMTIYGDPQTLATLNKSFSQGQQAGNFLGGLESSLPESVKSLLHNIPQVAAAVHGTLLKPVEQAIPENGARPAVPAPDTKTVQAV